MTKNYKYIIADHTRAICFIINEGVMPSGKQRGYVLRRLMRRLLSASLALGININNPDYFQELVSSVVDIYEGVYELKSIRQQAVDLLTMEAQKYQKAIQVGQKEWARILKVEISK